MFEVKSQVHKDNGYRSFFKRLSLTSHDQSLKKV
jgi:hypothetical protein